MDPDVPRRPQLHPRQARRAVQQFGAECRDRLAQHEPFVCDGRQCGGSGLWLLRRDSGPESSGSLRGSHGVFQTVPVTTRHARPRAPSGRGPARAGSAGCPGPPAAPATAPAGARSRKAPASGPRGRDNSASPSMSGSGRTASRAAEPTTHSPATPVPAAPACAGRSGPASRRGTGQAGRMGPWPQFERRRGQFPLSPTALDSPA